MLLRLYREEEPRAVLVAWDTLEVPTYRHEEFSDYQSGREFDDALVEQLDVLPEFVGACGFQNAKAPGFEADDFLAAAAAAKKSDTEKFSLPVETVIPFSSPPIGPQSFFPCAQGKSRASDLQRCASDMASILIKFLTSLRYEGIHLTKCPARGV